jgi:aerobic carbon-monoxide dehydrogenase medium subunit
VTDRGRFEAEAYSPDRSVALLTRPRSSAAGAPAGGVPLLRFRLAGPEALANLAGPAGLSYIRVVGSELRIGSLTTHAELIGSALISEHVPILREAERIFAGLFTPRRETIGGTLCQAAPADDLTAALTAVRAGVVIEGPLGTRIVPARDLQPRPYETVIERDEFLTEVRIRLTPAAGGAYELGAGGCGVTGAGAALWLNGDTVAAAGLALTSPVVQHAAARAAEEFLTGCRASQTCLTQAGDIVASQCACSSGRVEEPGRVEEAGRPRGRRRTECESAGLVTRALGRALLRARRQDA